jgi:hypothetical protein
LTTQIATVIKIVAIIISYSTFLLSSNCSMMLVSSSSYSFMPEAPASPSAGQSVALSPKRKKARRVSDPIEAIPQQPPQPTASKTTSTSTPANDENKQQSQTPLDLLCHVINTQFDNKENIAPSVVSNKPHRPVLASKSNNSDNGVDPMQAGFPVLVHSSGTDHKTPGRTLYRDAAVPQTNTPRNPIFGNTKTLSGSKRSYQPWSVRFQELLAFKDYYGNCRVPQKSAAYPSLARWVVYMRSQYKCGKLSAEKAAKLEAVGFEWNAEGSRIGEWNEHFKTLKAFQKEHGHLNVLQHEDPDLHYWCYLQRQKRMYLSLECLLKLDQLGFDWGIYFDKNLKVGGDNNTDKLIDELQIFYRMHGHAKVPADFPPAPALAQWAQTVTPLDLDKKQAALLNSMRFLWKKSKVEDDAATSREAASMTNYSFLRTLSVEPTSCEHV